MDAINKSMTKVITWCIILTAILPVGILMTIFSAINKQWVVMAFGIAFIIIGFYGTPLIWVKFGDARSYKRIVVAIAVERIFSIEKIANHLNLNQKVVLEKVDTCIRREFLIGYIREGDTIRPNVSVNVKTLGYKCQSCGAGFESPVNAQPKCPYCNTIAK